MRRPHRRPHRRVERRRPGGSRGPVAAAVALALAAGGCGRLNFEALGGAAAPGDGAVPVGDGGAPVGDGAPPDAPSASPPCTLFVNDASSAGDRFTSAPGDDAAAGTAAAPFATVAHALAVASDGDVVCVDAGRFDGDLTVARAGVLRGPRAGESGCGRAGAEAVLRGHVEVAPTAAEVTVEGLRFEAGLGADWKGTNLAFASPIFHLRDVVVIPRDAVGGFNDLGYVATKFGASFASIDVRGLAVAPLGNTKFASALAIGRVTVSGAAVVEANCLADSGENQALLFAGDFASVVARDNVLVDTAGYGAGISVKLGSVTALELRRNRVTGAARDGLLIASAVTAGEVRENQVNGSGRSGAGYANLTLGVALPAGVILRDNDLAAPAAGAAALAGPASGAAFAAPCQWFGSADAATVAGLVKGAVDPRPFLVSGADADPATPGLQPMPGACVGM